MTFQQLKQDMEVDIVGMLNNVKSFLKNLSILKKFLFINFLVFNYWNFNYFYLNSIKPYNYKR